MADMNLGQMTPEELQRLFELGPLGEEKSLLEDQLAQAQALRSQPSRLHSTGAGGAFGALGDVLRTVAGYKGEGDAREGLRKNAGDLSDRRQLLAQALIRGLSQGGAGGPPGLPPGMPPSPMSGPPGAAPGAPGQPPSTPPGYGTGAQIQQPTPMALRRRPLGPFGEDDDSDMNAGY